MYSFSFSDIDKDTIRIGELLVERGLVTATQVTEALARQREAGGLLGQTLVDMGALDERPLADALAWKFDIPECDLRTQLPERQAVTLLPEEIARAWSALPVTLNGNDLFVAVVEPSEELRKLLTETTRCSVHVMIGTLSAIRQAIDTSYGTLGGVASIIESDKSNDGNRRRTAETEEPTFLTDESPVNEVVNRILTQALRERASDIHLEPQDRKTRVRFRIDGVMKESLVLPSATGLGLINRIKTISQMNVLERRRPQEGRFTTTITEKSIDIRVATISTIFGETCVLRMVDRARPVFKLDALGFPADLLQRFSELIHMPFGMVVCAGPSGSGKTTTLYSTISELDDPSRNIMTIEDHVEYVFPTMNQVETSEEAGVTFATGLKSILRQDPDVVLVGEIRDAKTARIAIQSALAKHLIFCSLPATDSVAALNRFREMGIEPFLIAASVIGVVSQRLVRRTCTSCKIPYTPTPEERAVYEEFGGTERATFSRGSGCDKCSQTGYEGRIGVYELLPVTSSVEHLVASSGTDDQLRVAAHESGMRTLREQAINLVDQDVTTISEIVRSLYFV